MNDVSTLDKPQSEQETTSHEDVYVFECSHGQQRLWLLDRLEPGQTTYNMPLAMRLLGHLDEAALSRALDELIRRHESLRTTFLEIDGKPMQVIHERMPFYLRKKDLSALPVSEREDEVRRCRIQETSQCFDLTKGPLIRAVLLKESDEQVVLLLTLHHIIADGWSLKVFLTELETLYEAYHQGHPSPLAKLPLQYADYAHWQRDWLEGEDLAGQQHYWLERLGGELPVLELPSDRVRPPLQSYRGALTYYTIPATLRRRLEEFGRNHGTTLFMILLTGFKILLSRYTGQHDILVGTPVAGRTRTELEGLIGFFVNTLVLRTDLSGAPSVSELLTRVKETALGAYAHQDLPFERLVEALQPERDLSHSPLFQVMIAQQNTPQPEQRFGDLQMQSLGGQSVTSRFDLSVFIEETAGGELKIGLEYSTDLFDAARMDCMVMHWTNLLQDMMAKPTHSIECLRLLSEEEQHQILVEWNNTATDYPADQCIHQLFEAQSAQQADAVALLYEGQALSYGELNAQANRLGRWLRGLGVGPDQPVAICLERSFDLLVALLGVLKAGGYYVPLDPEYPRDRLAMMLDDCGARVVLTHSDLSAVLPESEAQQLCLDKITSQIEACSSENLEALSEPRHLAYMIYTSGSTGRPKGVMVEHGGVVNRLEWMWRHYRFTSQAQFIIKTPHSFDVSVWELFMPLMFGASTVIARPGGHKDPEYLQAVIEASSVNVIHFVPSMLSTFLSHGKVAGLKSLQRVICSGEALPAAVVARFHESLEGVSLENLYGPTEASIDVTAWACKAALDDQVSIPIGRPIANTEVYVLDSNLSPVPIGVAGELYLGGVGIARGYHQQPGLTAERFIPDPFSGREGKRLYKTGDLACFRPDGVLGYLGRLDHQVKIRGFRIELGEIEAALRQRPGIEEAVVVTRSTHVGDEQLLAYMVAEKVGDLRAEQLRVALKEILPEYMIPAYFIFLDADSLPLMPNGKVDRKALPEPDREHIETTTNYTAPRTEIETALAELWSELLGVVRVGIHDNFFHLGGHSLLATRLVAQIRDQLGIELALRSLFEHPILVDQAQVLDRAQQSRMSHHVGAVLKPVPRDADLALSYAQQRLWFLDKLESKNCLYHIPGKFRLSGILNVDAVERALKFIVDRHEIFRTVFKEVNGIPYQEILTHSLWKLSRIDLTFTDKSCYNEALQQAFADIFDSPFDLSTDALIRTSLVKLRDDEYYLLINMHHIISDGWSIGILIKEFVTLYRQVCDNQDLDLPPINIQYADFSAWQRRLTSGDALWDQVLYWKRQLADITALNLSLDHSRPNQKTLRGDNCPIRISNTVTQRLVNLCNKKGVTLFMAVLAIFSIILSRYSDKRDICIGTPIANRTRAELEPLIGVFVNTLPLRINLSGNPTFSDFLGHTREVALQAYTHQDVPFEKIVEVLNVDRDLRHSPVFQVMFVLQNTPKSSVDLPGLMLVQEDIFNNTAKYDLTLSLTETTSGLKGYIQYNTDLFHRSSIENMGRHLEVLIDEVLRCPDAPINDLNILTEQEKRTLLYEWNDVKSNDTQMQCVHHLFEKQAFNFPDATAIVYNNQKLTYGELNINANKIAHYLIKCGVKLNDLVPIYLERSLSVIVALIAVLKAGGAYVALDPHAPRDRIAHVLDKINTTILITQKKYLHLFSTNTLSKISVDTDCEIFSKQKATNPVIGVSPENLVYAVFTSGTTGSPKGVLVEHRQLSNYIYAASERLSLSRYKNYALSSNISTDLGNTMLFPALCFGGILHVINEEISLNGEMFADYIRDNAIDCIKIVPSHLRALLESGCFKQNLPRIIILGGEIAHWDLLQKLRVLSKDVKVFNHYGPSESVVGVTVFDAQQISWQEKTIRPTSIPIGSPLPGCKIYILDSYLNLLPVGRVGEIFIGGKCISRGYLDDERTSEQKFVDNPYAEGRLYRSGDLARYLPEGVIEFLGRIDHQVKVRGFRIELGEIETMLLSQSAVREAVVIAHERDGLNQELLAYVVADKEAALQAEQLRMALKEKLPEYMMPAKFIFMEAIPLTPNGKVDRRALPAPDWSETGVEYVALETPTEQLLAQLWSELLDINKVGRNDNFFHLGGHSLLATRLVARIRDQLSIELALRSLFEHPILVDQAQVLDRVQQSRMSHHVGAVLKPVPRDADLPLSYAQQRLWFLDRLEPGRAIYNMPFAVSLRGELKEDALERAMQGLVERHEVLRTRFEQRDGHAVQVIDAQPGVALTQVDMRDLPAASRETALHQALTEEGSRGFDLTQGPLFRMKLVCLDEQTHVLALTLHHIIADGWSLDVLMRELGELYAAACTGREAALPALPIQYADYAHWQRAWLEGEELERQQAYWLDRLGGDLPVLELTSDRVRPPVQSYQGAVQTLRLSPDLSAGLEALAQREGVTLFMVLLAGFKILLSRYTGQSDIIVGAPVAGRTRIELEGLIGFFVNTLVLRTDLSGAPSVRALLARVKETTLGAYAHQDLPFERLVEALQPERDLSHSPLFQVLFVLQNTPRQAFELAGMSVTPADLDYASARFDLSLVLEQDARGIIRGQAEYSTELFEAATIERMFTHWVNVLTAMVAEPTSTIERLALLGEAERRTLLALGDGGEAAHVPTPIHHLFEAQVRARPQAVALESDGISWCYAELERQANRLAHVLRARGVGPEVRVGVCLRHGPRLVQALLAVLKAGGVYVPLDPSYPHERLAYMLEDSAAALVLSERAQRDCLPATEGVPCVWVDELDLGAQPDTAPAIETSVDQLAYVIYTSGSTGLPKGVAVTHTGLANLAHAQIDRFAMDERSRSLQMASTGFDASVAEILTGLLSGGCLVFEAVERLRQTDALHALLRDAAINTVTMTPSLLGVMEPKGLEGVTTLIAAGAALPPSTMRRWAAGRRLYNAYGPTEASVCATIHGPCSVDDQAAPIGKAMQGVHIHIVDTQIEPVPQGVVGELCIAGIGVARGYLNRAGLTAEKFIPDPFSTEPGARLYHTGDLARYRNDGLIEFIGRTDEQIELRGYRIEPGEIEACLMQHPQVREAAVVVVGQNPHERRLVAYLAGSDALDEAALRTHLRATLPEYMLPTVFIALDHLPQTPNGKVDQRALVARTVDVPQHINRPPRDELEHKLVQIWSQVLHRSIVTVDDDFFEIGGHSIKAVELVARIERELGVKLGISSLFEHRSIAALATWIRNTEYGQVSTDGLVALKSDGDGAPLVLVHPIGGSAFVYTALAAALGDDRPVYAIQAPWLMDTAQGVPKSIDEMADRYISILDRKLDQVPLCIGGWSYGGLVAIEMARRLQAGDRLGGPALLIDPTPVNEITLKSFELSSESERLNAVLHDLLRTQKDSAVELPLVESIDQAYEVARAKGVFADDLSPVLFKRTVNVYLAHASTLSDYSPAAYTGPVQLYRATGCEEWSIRSPDPMWRALLPALECEYHLSCDHYEILQHPKVAILADYISDAMDDDDVSSLTLLSKERLSRYGDLSL